MGSPKQGGRVMPETNHSDGGGLPAHAPTTEGAFAQERPDQRRGVVAPVMASSDRALNASLRMTLIDRGAESVGLHGVQSPAL